MKRRSFDLFPVSVHLFFRRDNSILMIRRRATGFCDGMYSVPAGHVSQSESILEAAVREAREEVGLQVSRGALRVVGIMHRRSDQGRIDFFLEVDDWSGEPTNNEPHKCSEVDWFPSSRLPDETIPYVNKALRNSARPPWFEEFEPMNNNGHKKTYDVFCSHSGFPEITELLCKKVERVGAPPWRFKNLKVFLDLNETRTGELLPQSISEAIQNSKYFLLLASKAAAQSPWVAKEVSMWLKSKPASRILIVVLEGTVKWDEDSNDFDWAATNCLPKILSGKYRGEPSRASLGHILPGTLTKTDRQRLLQAAASVAAQILGVSRDAILNIDRTWWRRTVALAMMVMASLIMSIVLLVNAAVRITRIPADLHYQNGQTLIGQRSKFQNIRDALDEFNEALRLDPHHQEALLAKAFALTLLVGYGGASNPAQAHQEAEQTLAQVQDKTTSEYYHVKGRLVLFKDKKPLAALPLLETAVRLDPKNVEARHSLANTYTFLGAHKQAEALCLQAIDIAFQLSGGKPDKRFIRSKALLAWTYYYAGDYQKAEELCLNILEVDDPSYELANRYLGQIYIQRGDYEKAINHLVSAGGVTVGNPNLYANLTAAMALGGRRQEAYQRIQHLLARRNYGEYVSHYRLAQCYASLGETDKALDELRRALKDEGEAFVVWSAVDPLLSSLHGLKEFDEYLKSLDLGVAPPSTNLAQKKGSVDAHQKLSK